MGAIATAVLAIGALAPLPATATTVTVANAVTSISFETNTTSIALTSVAAVAATTSGAEAEAGPQSAVVHPFRALWELQLLTAVGVELCPPSAAVHTSATPTVSRSSVTLRWLTKCPGPSTFEVEQVWSLEAAASAAASVSFRVRPCLGSSTMVCLPLSAADVDSQAAGLWAVASSVGGVGLGHAFFPEGYGQMHTAGYTTHGGFRDAYPGARATMQFMAVDSAAAAADLSAAGLYFAAHDPGAHMKWLVAHEHTATRHDEMDSARAEDIHGASEPQPAVGAGADYLNCVTGAVSQVAFPLGPDSDARAPPNTQSLTITTLLEGAGTLLNATGYQLPFDLAVAPLAPAPTPIWYRAAEVYRRWAITEAEWTAKGPIADRPTHFAQWFLDLNVWVNSGWQCYDRFNDTQGDPPTVLANARAIARRFNLSTGIGLHWYEWQCGFPDLCTANHGAHRFKFDTMYPDYDPPRRGDVFGDVVRQLREDKVYTFPYINGRIFDNHSTSFKTEDGVTRVIKQAMNPKLGNMEPLLECKESYGSEELDGELVFFDVADPSTEYWQEKYAGQVSRLINLSGTSGVYIDQLAAGAPIADFTPRPEHGVGGGGWWRKGLVKLLGDAHARTIVDGAWSPLVIESNAEFLMDQANGLLTLSAFQDAPFALPSEPAPGTTTFAPAFPAIYGGYFVGFGTIYTQNDLALNPDVFASRLAANFVWGVQMGWFSLAGVDHGPNLDTRCGPMYTLNAFMDPKHTPEVEYLRNLAECRGQMSRYFVHGRLVAPVIITPTPKVFMAPNQTFKPGNPGPFPELSTSVWVTPATSSKGSATACIFLVTPTSSAVPASFEFRPAAYGLQGDSFDVVSISCDGREEKVDSATDGLIHLKRTVPGRSVEMLEIRPSAS